MTLLRRHGRWLIIAALAGVVGAWLFHAAEPHAYRSTAQVDVEANPVVGGTQVVPNMATEQQVATSGVIVGRTAAALHDAVDSVTGHLSAAVTSTANVLSIGCTQPTPAAARRCASAAAAAYIGFRNLPSGTKAQQAHDPLHVTLVTPAALPAKPAGTGERILLPLGAILGLALGVGAIVIRDRFDDRVRDRADLERHLEAPVLTGVGRVLSHTVDPALVFCRAPHSPAAEAYRYLRSRLRPLLAPAPGGGKVLLVVSPQGGEGTTCVAANLARALAQAGASVLLVDADLRPRQPGDTLRAHPSLSEVFRAGTRPGLTELLAGKVSLDEVARREDTPRLRFVAAGSAARDADIFEVADLSGIFHAMSAAADVVVVDSAPVLAVSAAVSLARASDLVVLVADARRTGRGAVSAAAQEIRSAGLQVIVGVLNNEPKSANRQAPSGSDREREWPAAAGRGPGRPSGSVTADGPDGQRPVPLGAGSTQPYGWPDPGTGADDPPEPGPASP